MAGAPPTLDDLRVALRTHMREHGISIAALARDAGYDYSGLHRWLSGDKADITLGVAVRLFAAAKIPLRVD